MFPLALLAILADETAPWWKNAGENLVWFAAALTALGVIYMKTPLSKVVNKIGRAIKWVWNKSVAEPVTKWGKELVGEVVEQKVSTPDDGHSVADRFDELIKEGVEVKKALELVAQDKAEDRRQTKEALETATRERAEAEAAIQASLTAIHNCLDRRFSASHEATERLTVMMERVISEAGGTRERIRQLYRAMDIPIFEADSQGLFVYVNPAFSRVTGLIAADAFGEGWAAALHPEDRSRAWQVWSKSVETGIDFGTVFRFRNLETGAVTMVHATASPMHDGSDGVLGWVGTAETLDFPDDATLDVEGSIS